MIDKERIEELTDRLLAEGELEPAEAVEVRAALAESEEARAIYLARCEVNLALTEAVELGILGAPESAAPKVPVPAASPRRPSPTARTSRGFGPALLKLAAALVLGTGAWWIGTTYDFGFGSRDTDITAAPTGESASRPETSPPAEAPVPQPSPDADLKDEKSGTALVRVTSPQSPGTLPERDPVPAPAATETTTPAAQPAPMIAEGIPSEAGETPVPEVEEGPVLGMVWSGDGSSDEWKPGVQLVAGEYSVDRGTIEFRMIAERENDEEFELEPGIEEEFHAGVRILVAGPARFEILSANHVHLLSGKLSAEVLPTASGFRITANALEVTDYGTRFAVSANTKGDAAVHVYNGRVTAGITHQNTAPLHLASNETLRLNSRTDILDPIDFDAKLFTTKPAWSGNIESQSRDIELLDKAPRDVRPSSLPTGHVLIFREREKETLRRDIAVNDTPNTEREPLPTTEIPEGRKVSSYLLHFKGEGDDKIAEGVIRFDSPILGIIYDTNLLNASDRFLGSRRTDYPSESTNRGLENNEGETKVRLGENGRTLQFRLHGPKGDQIRIVVAQD